MRRAPRFCAPAGRLASAALLGLLAFTSASAKAMPGVAGDADLSPRLAKLAKPSLRSASPARQAASLDLARTGPGSLLRQGSRLLAYVRFAPRAPVRIDALREAGARIVDVSHPYRTVTIAARADALPRVARLAGVTGVTEVLTPVTAATCPSGEVVSEGMEQLLAGDGDGSEPEEAEEARYLFSVDGAGVGVGVLSDSFDQATQTADESGPIATSVEDDVVSADLPGVENECGHTTPVKVLEGDKSVGGEGPSDEGRAMAQTVHDLAPGASLSFTSAFNGEISFANNIEALAADGADVIVDDVFYLEEPFFQDGPVAVAVDTVVDAGVAYFSAAGNDNLIDAEGHDIASWEAPTYRDAGSCPQEVQQFSGANGTHCMDFHPGSSVDRTLGVRVPPGTLFTLDLQWSEPWLGVGTDLDAYLLDFSGELIALSVEDNLEISQKPVEILQWENRSGSMQTVQIVVNRYAGASPRLKLALLGSGAGVTATEYPRSTGEDVVGPTVFGHSGSPSAISAGAVRFNTKLSPEWYSSRGPVRHDFGPVDEAKAADPLPSPEIVSKPDLVATDCGLTTFFATQTLSGWRFCGTSAAAPHAAAIAALMLEEKPSASAAEVRTALQASAVPVGAFGPCAVGAGLVEAAGAIEALLAPPSFTPPNCLPPAPEGSPEEARAAGNWGSETPPAPAALPVAPPSSATLEPHTFIRLRPAKVVRTRGRTAKVVFRFASDVPGASFACRIDGGQFRPCPERLVRRFGPGWHTLRVVAHDEAGNRDRTPAYLRFQVKRLD